MEKNKFGILLAATGDSAFTIGTLLVNLQDKMQGLIDVFYIVNDGFSENDKKIMLSIIGEQSRVKFIDFSFENFSENISKYANRECKINPQEATLKRYTHMSFARFEALKLLGECECIVYLDFDMLLLKEIGELREIKQKGYDFACYRGSASLGYGLGKLCPQELKEFINYSTGIIVFTNNISNPPKFYESLYQFMGENFIDFFKESKLPDQALFSLILFKEGFKVFELGYNYYGNISWIKSKEASIINAWGKHNRFWNNKLCALAWPQWNVYYQKWLSLGGRAYENGWKANNEIPESGGEVWQYFERILWAKSILEMDLGIELIPEINFAKGKLKFYFAGIERDIFLNVYSNSIHNYILEFAYKNEIIDTLKIERRDLKKSLKNFIDCNFQRCKKGREYGFQK